MNSTEDNLYIIKTTNPVTFSVVTYSGKKHVISVGSAPECDLILSLPSISPVHIIVNYTEGRIKAIGNDVRCDGVLVTPESGVSFTNKSLISIHNIFMMFLHIENNEETQLIAEESDQKLIEAASKYSSYSPYLKISHSSNTRDLTVSSEFHRNLEDNLLELDSKYKKEMGDFSEMPALPHTVSSGQILLKNVEDAFEDKFQTPATKNAVAAIIDSQISKVEADAKKAVGYNPDISMVREAVPDLERTAIMSEILLEARNENDKRDLTDKKTVKENNMEGVDSQREKILEAEMKSIDDLRASITDTMKEEFRSTISSIIQEETKDQVEKEVEKCFQEPKFAQYVADAVAEHSKAAMNEVKESIEDLREIQSQLASSDEISEMRNSKNSKNINLNKEIKKGSKLIDKRRNQSDSSSAKQENSGETGNETSNIEESSDTSVSSKTSQNFDPKISMDKQNLISKLSKKTVGESPKKKKADTTGDLMQGKSETFSVKRMKKNEEAKPEIKKLDQKKLAAPKKPKETKIMKISKKEPENSVVAPEGRKSERTKKIVSSENKSVAKPAKETKKIAMAKPTKEKKAIPKKSAPKKK